MCTPGGGGGSSRRALALAPPPTLPPGDPPSLQPTAHLQPDVVALLGCLPEQLSLAGPAQGSLVLPQAVLRSRSGGSRGAHTCWQRWSARAPPPCWPRLHLLASSPPCWSASCFAAVLMHTPAKHRRPASCQPASSRPPNTTAVGSGPHLHLAPVLGSVPAQAVDVSGALLQQGGVGAKVVGSGPLHLKHALLQEVGRRARGVMTWHVAGLRQRCPKWHLAGQPKAAPAPAAAPKPRAQAGKAGAGKGPGAPGRRGAACLGALAGTAARGPSHPAPLPASGRCTSAPRPPCMPRLQHGRAGWGGWWCGAHPARGEGALAPRGRQRVVCG